MTLRGYRPAWLSGDVLAAVMLLAIAVPEQLATSRLANMPPITGFYAFAAGGLMFAAIGSSPHLSVGADSTIAPLFAVSVGHLAQGGSERYTELVALLAVMVGIVLALVWLLRLGWIAEFLSAPVITGFLAGIGVVIVVHQLPDLLGIHVAGGSTVTRVREIGEAIGDTHVASLAIGLGVFACVVVSERVSRKLPGALLALVGATVVVAAAGLEHHGVAVLGHVAHAMPRLGLRGLSAHAVAQLAPIAGIVALVVIIQSAATTRAFAEPDGPQPDVGVDLLAVGAGSALAGLVGAFPVNASPARSAAIKEAGGRTQLTSVIAAVAVLGLVPAAGLLTDVPLAALAGVLLFIASRLFHVRDLRAIARFDRFELGLALVTLVAVAVAGVEWGIGVAVALAILDRTRIVSKPQVHVLGRIPGSTSWVPLSSRSDAEPVPGVLVLLFATSLWYANSVHFRGAVTAAVARDPQHPPRLLVLDVLGMTDIDYTGTQALAAVIDDLAEMHVTLAFARAGDGVRAELRRSGLLARIGEDHLFPAVGEAVDALG